MIRECVEFVDKYIQSNNTTKKSVNSFIIDDILLQTAEDDEKSTEVEIEETIVDETQKKSEKKEVTLFLIFPFENSENGLKLKHDKVVVRTKPKDVTELLELDIIKEYNYSDVELNDLKGIFETPEKHIALVSDNNKRIGGSQNLSSSVIYAIELASCKTSDGNLTEFKKGSLEGISLGSLFDKEKDKEPILKTRLEKFAYNIEYNLLCNLGFNNIGSSLSNWFYSTESSREILNHISKLCAETQGNSSIIIINLIPHQENISNIYAIVREEYFKQNVFKNNPEIKGTCACCQKKNCFIDAPQNEIAMDSKKRFLEHPTMMFTNQCKPILICHDCAIKYAAFFGLLKKWKIKIMPLFVDTKLYSKEIRLIDENGLNSFSQIFNQLGDSDSLEFYLILFTGGELKYFDYVCNYNWKLNWSHLSNYRNNSDRQINKITRRLFERKICLAIGINYLDYFEEKKGLNNLQSFLRSLLAEKLFNFVYRNQNYFVQHDIWQLCILPIEQLAFGSKKDFKTSKQIKACLEIWFNRDHLINVKEGSFMSIEELRNNVQIGNSLERWAYRAGKAYCFLVSKRASGQSLELENIIRSHQNQNVKDAIVKKLEQRAHALDEKELKQFRLQFAELFAFDQFGEVEFKDLKPYFYAGYIDEIKINTKAGGDSNE